MTSMCSFYHFHLETCKLWLALVIKPYPKFLRYSKHAECVNKHDDVHFFVHKRLITSAFYDLQHMTRIVLKGMVMKQETDSNL
jgi:hypothetical protein